MSGLMLLASLAAKTPYSARGSSGGGVAITMVVVVVVLVFLFFLMFVIKQYKRCPSDKVLVVYGKISGAQTAKCMHGGGVFIWPLIQDYAFMSLEPLTIDIDLTGALSKKNIRVNVPSTFTIGVSRKPQIMTNAAERLLSLNEKELSLQARDIILGQLRLVIAMLSIEEINQDREMFLDLINKNVDAELNKIGLEVINVNIRDITDESGYIDAIGRKAAAQAVNQANIDVAEQDKKGQVGVASANREKEIEVANQVSQANIGKKKAERDQRITVSKYEAEGVTGEAEAQRQREVAVAEQSAKAETGKKQAEREKRVAIASLEAEAVEGENKSKASIADYNATLEERRAEAKRRGEVAMANAARDVLKAEKEREIAFLEKTELAQKEVDKRKIEIQAEAIAEQKRRIAKGEADAILARYLAEAEGTQKVLEAKAKGYEKLLNICGEDKHLAPTLLMVEKIQGIVEEQVKAIQNLKIDKITVWEGGSNAGGSGSTANFLKSLIGSLPPMHELAKQAGIELPGILGTLTEKQASEDDTEEK